MSKRIRDSLDRYESGTEHRMAGNALAKLTYVGIATISALEHEFNNYNPELVSLPTVLALGAVAADVATNQESIARRGARTVKSSVKSLISKAAPANIE